MEKAGLQGLPVLEEIAAAYGTPVLHVPEVMSYPHILTGNGQHLPNIVMVLLATIAAVELRESVVPIVFPTLPVLEAWSAELF